MKTKITIITLLTAIIFLSCERKIEYDIYLGNASGIITDSETGQAIDSVEIHIFRHYSSYGGSGYIEYDEVRYSGVNGKYEWQGLPDNYDYILPVKKHYVYYDEEGEATKIQLKKAEVNFEMTRYGETTVEGVISDIANGQALPGAKVTLLPFKNKDTIISEVITDNEGKFKIVFLQDYYFGSYTFNVSLNGYDTLKYSTSTLTPEKTIPYNFEIKKAN